MPELTGTRRDPARAREMPVWAVETTGSEQEGRKARIVELDNTVIAPGATEKDIRYRHLSVWTDISRVGRLAHGIEHGASEKSQCEDDNVPRGRRSAPSARGIST